MASEAEAAPAAPSKQDRDVTVEAVNHLIQGKRHLLVQDIPSAVNSLEEACRLLDACYGQMANECGDAYYHYGIALLESSRQETGILGNGKDAGSGSESDEEEEERDDEDEDDDEEDEDDDDDSKTTEEVNGLEGADADHVQANNKADNVGTLDKIVIENEGRQSEAEPKLDSEAKSEDLDASKKADECVVDEKPKEEPSISSSSAANDTSLADSVGGPSTAAVTAASSSSDNDADAGTSEEKKPKEEEEELSNLQVAWEVFEVAKVIFKRQTENNRDMQLKLAQVHLKLGEVAMESENYAQSIEDMLECLSIQMNVLSLDDRAIAETYYQLGLAYAFNSQFDLSIGSFTDSIKVLENRIANLEKTLNETVSEETNKAGDPCETAKKEIEELRELIPEIRDRVVDTEESQKNSVKLSEALDKDVVPLAKAMAEEQVDSTTSPSQVKPVMNIGHLVRKKRKPEDSEVSTSSTEGDSKRLRSELGNEVATNDGVSGSGDSLSASTNLNGVTRVTAVSAVDSGIDSTATTN